MGGDVPVDSEAPVVTSSISRPDPPAQYLGGAHRGRVCVRAFIGVSVCMYVSACVILCFAKKKDCCTRLDLLQDVRKVLFFIFLLPSSRNLFILKY